MSSATLCSNTSTGTSTHVTLSQYHCLDTATMTTTCTTYDSDVLVHYFNGHQVVLYLSPSVGVNVSYVNITRGVICIAYKVWVDVANNRTILSNITCTGLGNLVEPLHISCKSDDDKAGVCTAELGNASCATPTSIPSTVTTPPDSPNTGSIVWGVVGGGAALIVTIVVIVIVIRRRKCGGGEVNSTASESRHDNSNTVELLNKSAQSGDVAQERDPKPDKSTVVRRVSTAGRSHKSTGIAFSRKDGNHVTEIHEETTTTVKPYVAGKDANCSEMKMVGTDARDGPPGGANTPDDMVGTDGPSTDICVTVAGVQEHADQDKLKEGPKSQCVFSTGSHAPVHPHVEDTGNCEKLSYKAVLLYQPQPHLLYEAGDCATRACVVSEPKKIPQADGEFYPPLKNVPSDHMYIDMENMSV
eukprot:Em0006g251a